MFLFLYDLTIKQMK